MKKPAFLLAISLLAAQAVWAEYPRDAADRFKMKYGVNHPVVEQELREAREAQQRIIEEQKGSPAENKEVAQLSPPLPNSEAEKCNCECKSRPQ